jgi:hypothetical protein
MSRQSKQFRVQPTAVSADEPFLTPQTLAEQLPVAVTTIYKCTRGHNVESAIPCYRLSRKVVYFRWREVLPWIESTGRGAA